MRSLELKVPPPVVAVLAGIAMWGIAGVAPAVLASSAARMAAAAMLLLAGAAFMLGAVVAFRREGTTINPMRPETTSALVRSGVYRFTRNPVYVGDVLVLLAWAVLLSSLWSLLGPLAFALYIDRFQIVPEERALHAKFGAE